MSSGKIPEVFIIVLNWENAPDTIECLESVFKLTSNNFQVVVCDNASTDQSLQQVREWLARQRHSVKELDELELSLVKGTLDVAVIIIRNSRNYGYAGGNNRGLQYALTASKGDSFAWIINNDVVLDANALATLQAAGAARPEISFFGSTILNYRGHNEIQTQGGDRFYPWVGMSHRIGEGRLVGEKLSQSGVEAQLSYIVGAAVFVRLNAVGELGLMEEKYFLYFEEVDWATRARRQGLKLGYVPDSLVYHKEGSSIGSSAFAKHKSLLADYYGVKNRIVLTRKLFPWFLPTVYLAMLFTLLKRVLTGQFDRAGMVVQIMLGIDRRPKQP